MGTAVVLVVLAGIVALVIRSMVRDKKAGKSLQCGGNCSACAACGGHCHTQGTPDPEKAASAPGQAGAQM